MNRRVYRRRFLGSCSKDCHRMWLLSVSVSQALYKTHQPRLMFNILIFITMDILICNLLIHELAFNISNLVFFIDYLMKIDVKHQYVMVEKCKNYTHIHIKIKLKTFPIKRSVWNKLICFKSYCFNLVPNAYSDFYFFLLLIIIIQDQYKIS